MITNNQIAICKFNIVNDTWTRSSLESYLDVDPSSWNSDMIFLARFAASFVSNASRVFWNLHPSAYGPLAPFYSQFG
jgi:hypothetical protein